MNDGTNANGLANSTPPEREETQTYGVAHPQRFAEAFGIPEAHEYVSEHGEYTPRIGIIDTGIYPAAGDDDGPEELDVVVRREFGTPSYGHGTETASVAAANWGNDVGVDGVVDAEIVDAGFNFDAPGYDDGSEVVAAAFRWTVRQDVDIINFSASVGRSPGIEWAVDNALDNGVTVVTSAGNNDRRRLPAEYPSNHPDVISVGASDSYGERVSLPHDPPRYDDPPEWGSTWPADVCAWGVHVPSIQRDNADDTDDTPYWWEPARHGGTSAAAPTVAGIIGLMLRVNPDLSPSAARTLIRATGTPIETDHAIGPRVHAARAVKAAADWR